ncbi:MAG TPA: hypothetical protein VJ697_13910 [Nitrososphaeraceae archaeon]|nr:hypothetical protein [Nitrososphaeraceae archaeon]
MFQDHDEDELKKIIDEFILSSSADNESIKSFLRKVEFVAYKLGMSFYQMMFILIQNDAIHNRKSQ